MSRDLSATWSLPAEKLLRMLDTAEEGLDEKEAQKRLKQYGANLLKPRKKSYSLLLLLAQFNSPIILLLIFAAGLSLYLHQVTGASIILLIVFISGLLGFWQERRAADAVAGLLAVIQIKASVVRGGIQKDVPMEYVVPGDIIILRAGVIVPGDCRILQSKDLFVNEATLTGETYPAEKMPGILQQDTPLSRRINCLFMGTNVVSGTARAVVVQTYCHSARYRSHLASQKYPLILWPLLRLSLGFTSWLQSWSRRFSTACRCLDNTLAKNVNQKMS